MYSADVSAEIDRYLNSRYIFNGTNATDEDVADVIKYITGVPPPSNNSASFGRPSDGKQPGGAVLTTPILKPAPVRANDNGAGFAQNLVQNFVHEHGADKARILCQPPLVSYGDADQEVGTFIPADEHDIASHGPSYRHPEPSPTDSDDSATMSTTSTIDSNLEPAYWGETTEKGVSDNLSSQFGQWAHQQHRAGNLIPLREDRAANSARNGHSNISVYNNATQPNNNIRDSSPDPSEAEFYNQIQVIGKQRQALREAHNLNATLPTTDQNPSLTLPEPQEEAEFHHQTQLIAKQRETLREAPSENVTSASQTPSPSPTPEPMKTSAKLAKPRRMPAPAAPVSQPKPRLTAKQIAARAKASKLKQREREREQTASASFSSNNKTESKIETTPSSTYNVQGSRGPIITMLNNPRNLKDALSRLTDPAGGNGFTSAQDEQTRKFMDLLAKTHGVVEDRSGEAGNANGRTGGRVLEEIHSDDENEVVDSTKYSDCGVIEGVAKGIDDTHCDNSSSKENTTPNSHKSDEDDDAMDIDLEIAIYCNPLGYAAMMIGEALDKENGDTEAKEKSSEAQIPGTPKKNKKNNEAKADTPVKSIWKSAAKAKFRDD